MGMDCLINCFHLLEGFEGRAHGRCIQGHMRDPHTESLVDMCCCVERKHQCQLHNFVLENLKNSLNTSHVNNSNTSMDNLGEETTRGQRLVIQNVYQVFLLV